MIAHYLITALRHLWKYKVQNLIGVMGLTVGLFCFSVAVYMARFVRELDQCYENYDRLVNVELKSDDEEEIPAEVSVNLGQRLRELNLSEVEAVCTVIGPTEKQLCAVLSEEGKESAPYRLVSAEVDTTYHLLFTPHTVYGSWAVAVQTENVVVLTLSAAYTLFGEAVNPVGKKMRLYDKGDPEPSEVQGGMPSPSYTIQAVIEDLPSNASIAIFQKMGMFVMNKANGYLRNPQRGGVWSASTELLVRPGYSIEDLKGSLERRNFSYPLPEKDLHPKCTLMKGWNFSEEIVSLAVAFASIGVLILFSGLLNYFHFQFGTFRNRIKEYSIRKVEGGTGKHLFALLYIQILLVIFLSGVFLFMGIELLGPFLQLNLQQYTFVIEPSVLMRHSVQYLIILLSVAALFCVYYVRKMKRITIQNGIMGGVTQRGKRRGRNAMLGVQFFICFLFIAATGALYLQAEKASELVFGTLSNGEKKAIFPIENLATNLNESQRKEMWNRIRSFSGVKDVVTYIPTGDYITFSQDENQPHEQVGIMYVDSNYFSFFNLPVSGAMMKDRTQLIADENAQKKWNLEGKTCYRNGKYLHTVCGVSKPLVWNIFEEPWPYLYVLRERTDYASMMVKAYPGREKEVRDYLNRLQKEILPSAVYQEYESLYEGVKGQQIIENMLTKPILFLSVVCIVITILGVYSAITLDTERRQKEVAIRKVNGAGMKDIILIFAKLYLVLIGISALFAFPVFWLVLEFWKQMYTEFFDYGPLYWISVVFVVLVITSLTVWLKILRIVRINPAVIIRTE